MALLETVEDSIHFQHQQCSRDILWFRGIAAMGAMGAGVLWGGFPSHWVSRATLLHPIDPQISEICNNITLCLLNMLNTSETESNISSKLKQKHQTHKEAKQKKNTGHQLIKQDIPKDIPNLLNPQTTPRICCDSTMSRPSVRAEERAGNERFESFW